ncbi:hypothetical protein OG349_06345 [Streptomyces sp. NBC_01317]|uniref:hypothetical protein n=1 Tax=Streptomyces sp. NBC_01317 TaxID=2903822 RepID=UPI002E15B17E|nr:hypothetical protein OG349_06345 [Streptomyces sp. NBC_01317]
MVENIGPHVADFYSSPSARPEHPRAGGEDGTSVRPTGTYVGTPPRWRGSPAITDYAKETGQNRLEVAMAVRKAAVEATGSQGSDGDGGSDG